jgi:putative membrane protein
MLAFFSSLLVAGSAGDGHHGWWPLWLLVWAAVLGTILWLVLRRTRPAGPSGSDRAREILGERYARGEISNDEYRERLENLK